LQSLSLNSGSTPWATPPALCSEGFFGDRVSWPWLALKHDSPDLSFWVARITGMIHWHTAGSYGKVSDRFWENNMTKKSVTQCIIRRSTFYRRNRLWQRESESGTGEHRSDGYFT
jgi:hypothetical protein